VSTIFCIGGVLIAQLFGFVRVSRSPIVLVAAFLPSVLPEIERDADKCQH
jgi:hypothetical protein